MYAPLCELAGIDPEAEYYQDDEDGNYGEYDEPPRSTHKELFRQAWSAAFDTEELPPPVLRSPVHSPPQPSSPFSYGSPFPDEPPF